MTKPKVDKSSARAGAAAHKASIARLRKLTRDVKRLGRGVRKANKQIERAVKPPRDKIGGTP